MEPICLDGIAWFDDGPFMESTMVRTWGLELTSTRITQDFKSLPRALDVIIAAEGCIVKDDFHRTGRRSRRSDEKDGLKLKPRNSQILATLKTCPPHPDAEHSMDILRRGGRDKLAGKVEEIAAESLDQRR